MAAQPQTEKPQEESLASPLYRFTVDVDDADGCVKLGALDLVSSRQFLLTVKPEDVVSVSSHLCVTSQEFATLLSCAIRSQGGASITVSREEEDDTTTLVCSLAIESLFLKRKIDLNLVFQPPQD